MVIRALHTSGFLDLSSVPADALPHYMSIVLVPNQTRVIDNKYASLVAIQAAINAGLLEITSYGDDPAVDDAIGTAPTEVKTTAVDADKLTIWDSAVNFARKSIAWEKIKESVATVPGTAKTTPIDADVFTIWDSVASFVSKKVTWANIKATIIAATDLLYVTLANRSLPWAVATLPTGGDIVTGRLYRLTATDGMAPVGIYSHDGTGWTCVECTAALAIGNLGATPALSLISGAWYTFVIDQTVTSATIVMSRPGLPAAFSATNAGGDNFLVADITATGRTLKSVGWDTAIVATEGCTGTIVDDGTNLIITAGAFDA